MKKILIFFFGFFCVCISGHCQNDKLSLIYDFDGLDFEYPVRGIVSTNDSLYVICQTPNYQGLFFRIDGNGDGYQVIWEFDNVNRLPMSLIANDTVIYGTTHVSAKGGGTLFKYCLKNYTFEFIKDFDEAEIQMAQVKYITDSVLWLLSDRSLVDRGSIFSIEKDGTKLNKIYNDTNEDKGKNPVDFVFHNDSIYIAFYNGGGNPYQDNNGSSVLSGSIVRIKSDGTGYENLVKGGVKKGTQPISLMIRDNKLLGLFSKSANQIGLGGQFFQCNLDGSSYDSLGALNRRVISKMLSTDSLIYGISSSEVFALDPISGEIMIFENLHSNPDWGFDVVTDAVFWNNNIFFATLQGGPNQGGTILKWNIDHARILSPTTIYPDKNINPIRFYPNPTTSILMFDSYALDLIEIYDMKGKLVKSYNKPKSEINVSSIDNGLILVKYVANGKLYSQKIIKY